jgi:hypothetical protein
MLKIKEGIDLKELEKYGFIKDSYCPNKILPDYDYCYNFLRVDIYNRKICISSGVDEVNGDEEIIKLYDLIKDGLVEKVKE